MSVLREDFTAAFLNELQRGSLPELLGMEVLEITDGCVKGRMPVTSKHMAPNGYLHAASVITLADTLCGHGTVAHLPSGSRGFTTVELKSNFLGSARGGWIRGTATARHRGRTTQVWDAEVSDEQGKLIALFRCTQMVLT